MHLLSQSFATFYVAGISYLISLITARLAGPEIFGDFSLALSFGSILIILIEGGFKTLINREEVGSGQKKINANQIISTAVFHIIIVSLFSIVILYFFLRDINLKILLILTAIYFMLTAFLNLKHAALRGKGNFTTDAKLQILNRTVTLMFFLITLYFFEIEAWKLILSLLIGTLVVLMVTLLKSEIIASLCSPKFTTYKYVYLIFILEILFGIYFRFDLIIMNFLDIEVKEIGYYSAAFKILEFFLLLGTPISLIIFHRYRLFRDLNSKINLDTLYYLIGLIAFGIFISLPIFFNSEVIVKFVYGNEYLDSSAHVKIFSMALVFLLPKILLIQFLLAQEEEFIVIIILGIAVVLKILFIILTFDQLSVLSISLSLLFTEFFVSTMMFLRFNSILNSRSKKII